MKVKEAEFDSFAERWAAHRDIGPSAIAENAKCLKVDFNRLCHYVDKYENNVFEYKIHSKNSITINNFLYLFNVSTIYDKI